MDELVSRRGLLMLAGVAAAAATLAPQAALALPQASRRDISLVNTHTKEALSALYWVDGGYRLDALVKVNRFLRDHRTNQIRMMDPHLLDQLWVLRQRAGIREPFQIISGYRSPATNMRLRREGARVARHSLHMVGRAVDIRIPGYDLREVRKLAMDMKAGGVGYYPRSDFMHLDTGEVRHW